MLPLKKILPISLLTVFWLSTLGLPLSKHLCGRTHKVVSIGILAAPNACCESDVPRCNEDGNHCIMNQETRQHNKGHKGCCETQFSYLKIKNDYTPASPNIFMASLLQILVSAGIPVFGPTDFTNQKPLMAVNIPPPRSGTDLKVQYQSFLF